MRSAYITLGVPRNATIEQIQRAFHVLSNFHSGQALANLPGAADKCRELHAAYQVLSDPDSRAAHDRKLCQWDSGVHVKLPRAPLFDKLSPWALVLPGAVLTAAALCAVRDAEEGRAKAAARRAAAQPAEITSSPASNPSRSARRP